MPIITAFQGTVTVEGAFKGFADSQPFYTWTLTAYGQTIGELLDNLVTTSVSLANDVFAWVANNKPADYELKEDSWYIQVVHPEILETSKDNPATHSMKNDTGSGSSLDSIEDIVKFPVLIRDIQIRATATSLLLKKTDKSEIVDKAAVPHEGIYEVTSFNEMTKFGFSGAELDTILEIGEREGRLKMYREDLSLARSYRKQERETAKKTDTKTSWWKKLVA